jgi:integrase
MFPPGRKGGPEWRAAKQWEEDQLKAVLSRKEPVKTLTGWERLLDWGNAYLSYVERVMSKKTKLEKIAVMQAFFAFCRQEHIEGPEGFTRPLAYAFLTCIADAKSPNRANVYRKNLLAAWNWGTQYVKGFPGERSVLERIKPFPVKHVHRYVPPEEDVIKVLQQAHGQNLVFLMVMYFTGARRGEVFRLVWEDIDFVGKKIRLIDHKAGDGAERIRWLDMHLELAKALAWWRDARPCVADNVFMQTQSTVAMGLPYRQRNHFMNTLCRRAGVKPFGFHSIRHKSAAITFVSKGLSSTQILLGHSRASTTDIYVRSAGLYAERGVISEALGQSGIGKAIPGLLEQEMPREEETPEAFCTLEHVHDVLQ